MVTSRIEHPKFYSQKLKKLSVDNVLKKSVEGDAWDSWGVRDAAILTNTYGSYERLDDELTMYYTGSTNFGSLQQTGRAILNRDKRSWQRSPLRPVLSVGVDSWDSKVAATSWVMKRKETYYLFYRGSRSQSLSDAIGLATSTDGINFTKHLANPILCSHQFQGMRHNPSEIGVMNAVCDHEENILIFFEAAESACNQKAQIFGAKSKDGVSFFPLNHGLPVFSFRNVQSWPVKSVCNPRVFRLEGDWFALGFNGSQLGEYSIGLAFTKDFYSWIEHPQNPILVPRGWPPEDPMSGRLEGPCFDRAAILDGRKEVKMFFMAIPYGARNHENAVNAMINFEVTQGLSINEKIKSFPKNSEAVQFSDNRYSFLGSKEKSGYLHAHSIQPEGIKSVTLEFEQVRFYENDSSTFIVVSNTLNSLPRGIGQIIKITNCGVFVFEQNLRPETSRSFTYLVKKIVNRLSKLLVHFLSGVKYPYAPQTGWKRISERGARDISSGTTYTVEFRDEVKTGGCCFVSADQHHLKKNKIILQSRNYRIVTLAVYKADVEISDLKVY